MTCSGNPYFLIRFGGICYPVDPKFSVFLVCLKKNDIFRKTYAALPGIRYSVLDPPFFRPEDVRNHATPGRGGACMATGDGQYGRTQLL